MTGQPDAAREAWWAEQDRVIKAWREIMSSDVLIGEGNDADRPEVWIEAWTGHWDALADRLTEADALRVKVERVEALFADWEAFQAEQPNTGEGRAVAASLRMCRHELRTALGPPAGTADPSEAPDPATVERERVRAAQERLRQEFPEQDAAPVTEPSEYDPQNPPNPTPAQRAVMDRNAVAGLAAEAIEADGDRFAVLHLRYGIAETIVASDWLVADRQRVARKAVSEALAEVEFDVGELAHRYNPFSAAFQVAYAATCIIAAARERAGQ